MSQKKYYPTALALYITYFVLGIAASIMGHYKQEFAALWGAPLLGKGLKPSSILIIYPCCALLTLIVVFFVHAPVMCLVGGFLMGYFAAGGVLQLVTAVANEMFPNNRGVITSIVMISSSIANYLVISIAGVLTRVGGANGPSYVLLFNMAITLIGIVLAVFLKHFEKKESAVANN